MANKVNSELSTTQPADLPGNHNNVAQKTPPPPPQVLAPTDGNEILSESEDAADDISLQLVKLSKKCQTAMGNGDKHEKDFLRTLTSISDSYFCTDEHNLRRNGLPTLLSNGRSTNRDIMGWRDGVEDLPARVDSGSKRGKAGGSGQNRKTRWKGEQWKLGNENENFKFEFYNDPRKYLKQYKRFHSWTGQATKLRRNEAIQLEYPDVSYSVWDRPEANFPLKLDAINKDGSAVMMKIGKGNLITAPLASSSNVIVLQQKIQPPPLPQHSEHTSKSLETKKSKEQKLLIGPPFPHRILARSTSPNHQPQSLTELLKVQQNPGDSATQAASNNPTISQPKQHQNIKKRQPGYKATRAQSTKNQQQPLNYNHPPSFAIVSAKLSSKQHQYPWMASELLPQKQTAAVDKRPNTTAAMKDEETTATLKHNDYTVARMLLNWRRTYETTLKNNRSLSLIKPPGTACSDGGNSAGSRPLVPSNVSMYDTNARSSDYMKARPITHIGFRSRSCGFRQLNKMKI